MKSLPLHSNLRRFPLFRGVPAQEIRSLLEISKLHRVLPNHRITLKTGRGGLYIILAGSANIMQDYAGHETFLFSVEAGEFFGSPPLTRGQDELKTQFLANSPCDILEFEWDRLRRYLKRRTKISTLFFERVLSAAADKFAYLSREYCHLVQQAGVPEEAIDALFPTPPDEKKPKS